MFSLKEKRKQKLEELADEFICVLKEKYPEKKYESKVFHCIEDGSRTYSTITVFEKRNFLWKKKLAEKSLNICGNETDWKYYDDDSKIYFEKSQQTL